jgi:hypothetical protein
VGDPLYWVPGVGGPCGPVGNVMVGLGFLGGLPVGGVEGSVLDGVIEGESDGVIEGESDGVYEGV